MPNCFYPDCDETVEYFHCDEHFDAFLVKAVGEKCFLIGCNKAPYYSSGICSNHYERMKRHGSYKDPRKRSYASRSPSFVDLHWAAGFLEGEGSFTIQKVSGKVYEAVSAPQVQKEPLERIRDMFGGNLRFQKVKNPKHNDIWQWHVSGPRARGIMMTLFVLLSTRRKDQIREAFAKCASTKEVQKYFRDIR